MDNGKRVTRRAIRQIALTFLSGGLFTVAIEQTACTQESSDLSATVTSATTAAIVDRTNASTGNLLQWADGTYGPGCTGRSGAWSLRIAGDAPMDNPPLSVAPGDSMCVLTMTSVYAGQSYEAVPPIALGASNGGTVASFQGSDGGSVSFYATADLNCADNCVVSMLLADTPDSLSSDDAGSDAASVFAAPSATGIASPDYVLDLKGGAFAYEVDVNYSVKSVSGAANLIAGSVAGNGYFVDQGTLPPHCTFAQLDRAYAASSPVPIVDANPQVPASAFGLVGVSLTSPVLRTLVIQRVVSGVRSYQALTLTFGHS